VSDSIPAWGLDCELDEEIVGAVLRDQFRELAPWKVRFLQEGWDSRAYVVNDEWIFRMPKRANVVPSLMVERRLLPLLEEALPVDVPRFEWHGVPSDRFPHPFSGYRLLPGDLGDAIPRREIATPAVARQLGELLRVIHAVPVERAREAGVPEGREPWTPACWPWLGATFAKSGDAIEAALGAPRCLAIQVLLESELPVASEPVGLLHADLSGGHLLLDPETRVVTGIIDWADTNLGDPAIDFAAFEVFLGEEFVAGMLSAYVPNDRACLQVRIHALAKRIVSYWVVETLQRDPENLPGALRDFDRMIGTGDV